MKKLIIALFALVVALSLTIPGLAEDDTSRLIVTGTATISLPADSATIEIGAQTRGRTVAEAHQENARIMEDVIREMEKFGVLKDDIRTSQFYVYFEQNDNMYSAAENLIGGSYTVTNMVFITIRDISRVSEAIDAAASVGANNIYNLTFQSSKSTEGYNQALKRAVEDARAKALVLAEASGKTLGDIILIESNDTYGAPYGIQNRADFAGDAAVSTPILSGDVSISAYVTLTFALQ